MVKYIDTKTGYNLIKFDKESDEIKMLDSFSTNIDYMWIADEEGMLNDIHVNVGDIIIRMYGNNRETLVIKDEQLKNYYKSLKENIDKEREKHEKCCDCECCSDSCIKACK